MAKSFYIIDGHAQIYRAYFAPFRELSSPGGEPTKATFVFTQMLLSLIEKRKPDYLAMVIDGPSDDVFRKEILPEYKANRTDAGADFLPQEQRILRIVRDAGVPVFAISGFEADDLIATMAHRLCDKGFQTYIVSKDKDLRQIINDCTVMYDVQKDQVISADSMRQDCGYGPAEAIEVQTLTGDPIDNVPGIPGVGEKTAAKLIQKYGKAEAVLQHLDELTPKLRENFEKFGHMLPVSRKLVTLRHDVPMEFDAEACRFQGINLSGLRPHLEELGFTALLRRLEPQIPKAEHAAAPTRVQTPITHKIEQGLFGPMTEQKEEHPADRPLAATAADCCYHLVDTEHKLEEFLQLLAQQKRFAFDTETDALGPIRSNLVGVSFSWEHGTGWYIPVRGPAGSTHLTSEQVIPRLRPVMEDPAVAKVGHNVKYDLLVLRKAGIRVAGIEMDSMIAASLIDSARFAYGIDRLALDLFNFRKIATEELIGSGKSQTPIDRAPVDQVAVYASEDADIALRLADYMRARLKETPTLQKLHDELETPLIEVLAEMEYNGVAIDESILRQQSREMGKRIDELRTQILDAAGCDFNPDSPKQLADVLFTRLGLKVVKRTKTGASTDVEVLEKLALEHPVAKYILEYRSLQKLKNTYLDNLTEYVYPKTGRIHANFNQIGAETGRLSCNDPNLQNIPIRTDEGRRIRLAFVPADRQHNVLMTADYSQIELRVLAHFTEEPALMRAFEADEDIHAAVASEVFGVPLEQVDRNQRTQAKTINFGIIYGVSAFGLARRIDGLTVSAADELIAAYNRRFPSIAQFLQKCVMEAKSQGYVETILGRRRRIAQINSPVLAMRNAGERMAINSVVQGSAADLIKMAMLKVQQRLKDLRSRMLLQVHDELVFETPAAIAEQEAEIIRQEMCSAMQLKVPLKVEIGWGSNWQEGK